MNNLYIENRVVFGGRDEETIVLEGEAGNGCAKEFEVLADGGGFGVFFVGGTEKVRVYEKHFSSGGAQNDKLLILRHLTH